MANWHKGLGYLLSCSVLGPGLSHVVFGDASSLPVASRPTAVSHNAVDQPIQLGNAKGALADWLKAFDHDAGEFQFTMQQVQREEGYDLYRLTYPSPFVSPAPENNVVPAELYVPRQAGEGRRVPAAVVLDILNGGALIARSLASGLAENGVAALYMPMAYYGPRRPANFVRAQLFSENPQRSVDALRQSVMDARRAKAILRSLPQVDPHHLGITGVSLGGIMASLTAGVDGTFDRVVPILGGGDIAALTFHTRETHLLAQRLLDHDIDQGKLASLLAPVEPLNFASRIDPANCLMINASQDEVIPREMTDRLYRAIGNPSQVWVPAGHYSAIFFLPQIRKAAAEFLLGEPAREAERVLLTPAQASSR